MQSSSQITTTNEPMSSFFTGRMPFLSPNQQCQSTEGKISHSMDLLTPGSPGGLPTLSLTTNSSWLPWRRVAMPLISPLMPVPPKNLVDCWWKNFLQPRSPSIQTTKRDKFTEYHLHIMFSHGQRQRER